MTPDDIQDFRVERLKALIAAKFEGQNVALGRALNHKSGAFVRQMVDRERPITEKTVQKIEALPGCANWFLSELMPSPKLQPGGYLRMPKMGPGVGDGKPMPYVELVDRDPADAPAGAAESDLDHSVSHPSPRLDSVIRVPLLAVEASMGPGADLQGEEEMVRSLSLSPQWISTALRPARAEALRFIHGYGDSMAPTFNSGDVLLVDTDIADVNIPGVYVLEAQDQLFIKRVNRRLDGEFEISSDNPAHRTVEVLRGDHEVVVKGRVIWVWNGRKM